MEGGDELGAVSRKALRLHPQSCSCTCRTGGQSANSSMGQTRTETVGLDGEMEGGDELGAENF
jgi:hypothetical protein